MELLGALRAGMLVLADRGFASWKLFTAAAATGADLCWRVSASFTLPVITVLPDGTYLSELRPSRKRDGERVVVRFIEANVRAEDGEAGATPEMFALDHRLDRPTESGRRGFAGHFHRRWQAEASIDRTADLSSIRRRAHQERRPRSFITSDAKL